MALSCASLNYLHESRQECIDHGLISGLTTGDSHTQYALLAGRSGTNDFTGDVGVTGNLKLPATTTTAGIIKQGASTLLYTKGTSSCFVGVGAGNLTNTSSNNTGIGQLTLSSITTGQSNTGIGKDSLFSLTTGSFNVAIGSGVLAFLTTGSGNIGIGQSVLTSASFNGSNAIGIGNDALNKLTTGTSNVGIGTSALAALTTGSLATAVGNSALTNATGASNTAMGSGALLSTSTGARNTAIGVNSGTTNTTGNNNTLLGMASNVGSSGLTDAVAIGHNALVSSSNYIMLGTAAESVGIAGAAKPTTGTGGLIFPDGTALATMASNTAGMYADDIAGNVSMHAINENGDIIKLIKTGLYTPTNVDADRSYDADSTTVDELADVLGTLIADLQLTGFLG